METASGHETMTEGILVINAGSSSIKFSLYAVSEVQSLELHSKGLIEGIGGKPYALAKGRDGSPIAERRWQEDEPNDFQFCFARWARA